MIDESLFSRFLGPLIVKKQEKDDIERILQEYYRGKISIRGLQIKILQASRVQKTEILLKKEEIETLLFEKTSKKYQIFL